jgi:hypothetical protein
VVASPRADRQRHQQALAAFESLKRLLDREEPGWRRSRPEPTDKGRETMRIAVAAIA